MNNSNVMNLFNAFSLTHISKNAPEASMLDLVALAMEYRYVFTPELMAALDKLSPTQKGAAFKSMGKAFSDNIKGIGGTVSPLYRAFPNHTILPFEMRFVAHMYMYLGYNLFVDTRLALLYGANPFSENQDELFGANANFDSEFTIPFKDSGGNNKRTLRFLKLADSSFMTAKVKSLMENSTPFSSAEYTFVKEAISSLVHPDALSEVKFREKLPLVFEGLGVKGYTMACNSVTDVLRLATFMTDESFDLTLNTDHKFALKTSQAKKLVDIVELILKKGTTDHETDFLRHAEKWKRFAEHIRINKFENRAPLFHTALKDLRLGWMVSWNSKFAAADVITKIRMAQDRPGEFVRRFMEMYRLLSSLEEHTAFEAAFEDVVKKADMLKLLQLRSHITGTIEGYKRYHMLPNGNLMVSERNPENVRFNLVKVLKQGIYKRLRHKIPMNVFVPEESQNVFLPVGNRAMSTTDVRTSRGDRVKLDFEDNDVLRFFLHWHSSCDVDISAVFYDEFLNTKSSCSYFQMDVADFARHSGDIQDGSKGAAEYIDINVEKARKNGVRYVLMNANVYSGETFNTFPCHVGVMLRDGQTGEHFEVSTVESKLSLDSGGRNTIPALFDLETGEMIFLDLPGKWAEYQNVDTKEQYLKDVLEYYLKYADHRPSFGTVIMYGGIVDENAPVASPEAIYERRDELLDIISKA